MAATVVVRDPWTDLLRRVARALALPAQRIASALRLVLRTPSGRIGLPILLMHLILATVGPWLAPYSATEFQEPLAEYQLQPPSWQFWMGTDQFGRDILSRVMAGSPSLIAVSVSVSALGLPLGPALGRRAAGSASSMNLAPSGPVAASALAACSQPRPQRAQMRCLRRAAQ